jgi:hypothetical protein
LLLLLSPSPLPLLLLLLLLLRRRRTLQQHLIQPTLLLPWQLLLPQQQPSIVLLAGWPREARWGWWGSHP